MVDDADCCTGHAVGLVLVDALAEGEGVAVVVAEGEGVAVVVDAGADEGVGDGAGVDDGVLAGDGEGDCDGAALSATGSDVIAVRPMAVLHSC